MTAPHLLATLRRLGKPQTATIYRRHGAGDDVFGTLTSDIVKLARKIKTNPALSRELWKTGNAEARILALLIADPRTLTLADADRLLDDGPAHFLACYLCDLIAASPVAGAVMRAWMKSPDEPRRALGYGLLAARLQSDPDSLPDPAAEKLLATIERQIHRSPNRARHAMNNALITVGVFKPTLRQKAIDTAKRIGPVQVDHGDTNCKTPDAAAYIEKASKRRRCP